MDGRVVLDRAVVVLLLADRRHDEADTPTNAALVISRPRDPVRTTLAHRNYAAPG